jgi:hypothetical protein
MALRARTRAVADGDAIMIGCCLPELRLVKRMIRIISAKRRKRSGLIPNVMTGRGHAIPMC